MTRSAVDADERSARDDESGAYEQSSPDVLRLAEEERREPDADQRLDRDERRHNCYPPPVVRLEERDVRSSEEHARGNETKPPMADPLPRPDRDQNGAAEKRSGRGHRRRNGRHPDREMAHEVVSDREEGRAGERVCEPEPVEVRR